MVWTALNDDEGGDDDDNNDGDSNKSDSVGDSNDDDNDGNKLLFHWGCTSLGQLSVNHRFPNLNVILLCHKSS